MKKILIVAAPFGYGPSSKALIIAEYLRDSYQIAFSSSGRAARFLHKHRPRDAEIYPGVFRDVFCCKSSLKKFDGYIAVNHEPAMRHLTESGFANRTIFIDSLSQWRAEFCPVVLPTDLFSYVIQDEIREISGCVYQAQPRAHLTSPILWPDDECHSRYEREGVLIHIGGVNSPSIAVDTIDKVISPFIKSLVDSIYQGQASVTLMANADLIKDIRSLQTPRVMSDSSPRDSIRAIARAKLLVTTPGLGAVYEAISKRTPVILLPPVNSTQMRHYKMLTARGIPGVLNSEVYSAIEKHIRHLSWPLQSKKLISIWNQNGTGFADIAADFIIPKVTERDSEWISTTVSRMKLIAESLSKLPPFPLIKDQVKALTITDNY